MPTVMTVNGPIDSSAMGLTLPHEHVLVDFIGAKETGPHRYDRAEVVRRMAPYLEELVGIGVKSFVECTPMYLARDVFVLRELAKVTGIRIITNTGQYKEPFLPESTLRAAPEELASGWIAEFENGIDGTDCRPGFIKTAVNPEPLAPVQRTVISAAAITSRQTGLPIATHTGIADSAVEILDIIESFGVDPERWIFVHAQNESNPAKLVAIASRGAWIELDGIGPGSEAKHLAALRTLLENGYKNQVLLSHDAGWYRVGEPEGGSVRPFTHLFDSFIPLARRAGIDDRTLRLICSQNPGRAFSLRS